MKAFPSALALSLSLMFGIAPVITAYAADAPAAATVSDEELAKNVQAALAAEPTLKDQKISVTAKNQEVTLAGSVAEQQMMFTAGLIAEKTPGVKFVFNNIMPADYTPSEAAKETKGG